MPTTAPTKTPQAFTEGPRPNIDLQPVESNKIGAIGYDPESKTLAVQFRRGTLAIYHYPGVEPEQYEAFKGAESLGKHFGEHVEHLPFDKYAAPEAQPAEA